MASCGIDGQGGFVVVVDDAMVGGMLSFRVVVNGTTIMDTKGVVEWHAGDPDRPIIIVVPIYITVPPPPSPTPAPTPSPPGPSVSGMVLEANGGGEPGVMVQAFDKTLRHEKQIGHAATTDAGGNYLITYGDNELAHKGGRPPDLLVRAYDAKNNVIGVSAIMFRAPEQAQINVVVGGTLFVGFSELELTAQAVDPELDGASAAALSTDDVTFLANDTAVSIVQVQAYADANRLAPVLAVSVAALYGLLREGLPPDPAALAATSPQLLRDALTNAVSGNIVPASVTATIDATVAALGAAAATTAVAPPPAGQVNTGTILTSGGVASALQTTVVQAFVDPSVAPADAWSAIRAAAGAGNSGAVDRAQLAMQLGALTHNHAPLIGHLLNPPSGSPITSIRDLASLTIEQWFTMLGDSFQGKAIDVPSDVPGDSDAQRRWTYATTLARGVEEAFGAATLVARLPTGVQATTDLALFVNQAPDFDLVQTGIDAFVQANPSATTGVSDVEQLKTNMKLYQRLARVTPRTDEVLALAGAGLTSAQDIVRMTWGGFTQAFATTLGAQRADTVFGNASQAVAAAFALYALVSPRLTAPVIPALAVTFPNTGPFDGQINLPELIGSLDSCKCDDCRSLTSPAAYLVDLFEFMGPDLQPTLRTRRPDLFNTFLSCANTNTPMPYIDLVNETLEYAVMNPRQGAFFPVPPANFVWPQTTLPAEQLAAEPEHLDPNAYQKLSQAVYPWTLPFSLGLEEARVYLQHLGVGIADLMETLRSASGPADTDIARARLDMTALDEQLVIGPLRVIDVVAAADDVINPITPNGPIVVDGVQLKALDQVLIDDRTGANAVNNGIFFVSVAAWGRAPTGTLTAPLIVRVATGGQRNGGALFALSSAAGAVIGQNPLEFVRFDATPTVDAFLQQTGLSFDDLLDLVDTVYVGEDLLNVQFPSEQSEPSHRCDLAAATVVQFGADVLDRIQRFTRLRRKLGWTAYDLDAAVVNVFHDNDLATPLVGETILEKLANIEALRAVLGTSVIEALSWWADLQTKPHRDRTPSFYASLFENGAALDASELVVFKGLDPTTPEGQSNPPAVPWSAHLAAIGAVLGVSGADLALIADPTTAGLPPLNTPDIPAGSTTLTLEIVSRFFRVASLAQALGVSIRELGVLRALTDIDPFDASNTAATRALLKARDDIRHSPFTITELGELLLGIGPAPGTQFLSSDAARDLLVDVQAGLAKIATDFATKPDTTGVLLRKSLTAAMAASAPQPPPDAATTAANIDAVMAIVSGGSVPANIDPQTVFEQVLVPILKDQATVDTLFTDLGKLPLIPLSDRFGKVLDPVLAFLRDTLSRNLIIQKLAAAFHVGPAAMRVILTEGINSVLTTGAFAMDDLLTLATSTGAPPTDALLPMLVLVAKAALIVARFKMSQAELTFTLPGDTAPMFVGGNAAGWIDLNQLPQTATAATNSAFFAHWNDEVAAFAFRDKFAVPDAGVLALLASKASKGSTFDLAQLAALTGWSADDIDALTGPNGLLLSLADYASGAALAALSAAQDVLSRLGVPATLALLPGASVPSWPVDPAAHAAEIKAAAKAKHDQAEWLAVAKPLRDVLRAQQRDALVAWLIGHAGFSGSDQVFDAYLIDVEMSPCMLTSRIKQAIGATQLFIQRTIMNLEFKPFPLLGHPPIFVPLQLAPPQVAEWKWRGRYRIWQANRMVLLYPENFLVPSLRDDKTPFFVDLENELNQSNVTSDSAEVIFRHYLEKLEVVARLKVIATHLDPVTNVVHVLARTPGQAPRFFYRTYQSTPLAKWTPWTAVPLDISDNAVLVVWNRHVHVIWGVVTPQQDPPTPQVVDPRVTGVNPLNTPKVYELRLAWSELRNGKWSTKSISKDSVSSPHPMSPPNVHLDDSLQAQQIEIRLTTAIVTNVSGGDDLSVLGKMARFSPVPFEFLFPGCGGEPKVTPPGIFHLAGTILQAVAGNVVTTQSTLDETWEWFEGSGKLALDTTSTRKIKVLDNVGDFTVVVQTVDGDASADHPFFFQDDHRCFFVLPELAYPTYWLHNAVDPSAAARVSFRAPYIVPTQTPPSENHPLPGPPGNEQMVFAQNPIRSVAATVDNVYTTTRGTLLGQAMGSFVSAVAGVDNSDAVVAGAVNDLVSVSNFRFKAFHHPYVCDALGRLNRFGIEGLLSWSFQELQRPLLPGPELQLVSNDFFLKTYKPTLNVDPSRPIDEFDVTPEGAYSIYNWEIFFHAPFMIATKLSANQRFEDAQRWFHYIFDPTDTNTNFSVPARFWKFKKFFEDAKNGNLPPSVIDLIAGSATTAEEQSFHAQVAESNADPFKPFAIARLRTVAFQKAVIMAYIDNLIAWGDNLFSQNTLESINEATMLYILADEILGPRPVTVEPQRSPADDDVSFDELGNLQDPLEPMENLIAPGTSNYAPTAVTTPPLPLFFCVPANADLFTRWDTVADRLFKIRHCMNIQGQVEQLPLFEPPINPLLLIRAAAAGIDLASVLADSGAPLPFYRFQIMAQKTADLVGEVRALGQALLSALEKRDGEELSLLRANQEIQVLNLTLDIKNSAVDDATAALAALDDAKEVAKARQAFYAGLLAAGLMASEQQQLDKLSEANDHQGQAQVIQGTAAGFGGIPEFSSGVAGAGGSPQFSVSYGGNTFRAFGEAAAASESYQAGQSNYHATRASIQATHDRRSQDWTFQNQLAGLDITQITDQITSATARLAVANKEVTLLNTQIQNASDVRDFMQSKFTNQDLYDWMVGQVSATYFQAYQLAYDLAKRAERTFHREIGDEADGKAVNYIQFGYWDSLKQGLLAGERLAYDLKRMEAAYLEQNRRELEITKHVSLLLFDPVALTVLKETGTCFVSLPESLFDHDYPGHYMRRFKSVAVTVPCEVGPYTSVNCTFTLTRHSTRWNPLPSAPYPRITDPAKTDVRFTDSVGSTESIVTSSGQSDGGLFEVNLRDERYLPFEGAGVISVWRVDLNADTNAFDVNTITDVVMHIRYTARDGGEGLRTAARTALGLNQVPTPTLPPPPLPTRRLFSASQDFSDELFRFLNPAVATNPQALSLDLSSPRFPFHDPTKTLTIQNVRIFVVVAPGASAPTIQPSTLTTPAGTAIVGSFSNDATLGNPPTMLFDLKANGGAFKVSATDKPWTFTLGNQATLTPDQVQEIGILCEYTVP
jgi:hypothetical protein